MLHFPGNLDFYDTIEINFWDSIFPYSTMLKMSNFAMFLGKYNFFDCTYKNMLTSILTIRLLFVFLGFIIRTVLINTNVKFEPDTSGFELVLLNVIDLLLESINAIPRVESKLFASEENTTRKTKSTLKVTIDVNLLTDVKDSLRKFIHTQMQGPTNHMKMFDFYQFLVTQECDSAIEEFLEKETAFDRFIGKVEEYKEYYQDLQYKFIRQVQCGIFELHLEDILRKLAKR